MKDIQLSVIIPTRKGGKSLGDLLVSLTRQQGAPEHEIIVVANTHDPATEQLVRAMGKKFKYLCTSRRGANVARNMGLGEARGEIVLFLDDDCYLEEPLLLKRHYEAHQKYPNAIGIGGRYALKRGATVFEQTYHWIADYWLSRSRIDHERTQNLIGGNSSYKTIPLRTTFRFNDEIVFGGTETDLNARLVAAGQELILSDRLIVEHRLKMTPWTLLEKGFLQGLAAFRREQAGLKSHWRFQGERQTFEGNLEERGMRPIPLLRQLNRMYDLAFQAGVRFGARMPMMATAKPSRIAGELLREVFRRLRRSGQSAAIKEIFYALKFNVSRR